MSVTERQSLGNYPGASRTVSLESFATEIAARAVGERIVVAIVGPAGSGKSTTTAVLETALIDKHGLKVQVVPMDGFHYDNAVLEQLGLANRKGAPETFDVSGLEATLKRLTGPDRIEDVAVPVFDRDIDLSRASARLIGRETSVLLVEGNYLLMKSEPWLSLGQYFDLSAMISCDEQTLRARLMKRWLDLDYSEEDAARKVEANDIPNARRVIEESLPADFNLVWMQN